MVLLLVVHDRPLEVGGEDVPHDPHREVCLLEDQLRGGGFLDAFLQHLVELVQVLELALEVLALGPVGGGADDHAPVAQLEAGGLAAQAGPLAILQSPGDAHALAGGGVDHVAPGDRELHRQARALRLQRVLDDLHDDLLAGLEQLGDLASRRRARAGAPPRRGARSRRRAGSRSSRGRCRRRRPPARAGRCRPCPCRCFRRSSARRGARCRAQRRGSRRPGRRRGCASARMQIGRPPVPPRPPGARRASPRGRR